MKRLYAGSATNSERARLPLKVQGSQGNNSSLTTPALSSPRSTLRVPQSKIRIALYSHDAMGLGHARRNLLIAQTFAASPCNATVLMLAGAGEAAAFDTPEGVDCLTLPALCKSLDGHYSPRNLDVSFQRLISLRANTIRAALQAFDPDVFIVDKLPLGIAGELEPALQHLYSTGRARCILGLRDVLDDPDTVRREWESAGNDQALLTYYHAVWVYGDPSVYDLASEYSLSPEVAGKVRYTGYLDQRARLGLSQEEVSRKLADLHLPEGRIVLCLVGGGQDGGRLAEAFSQAPLPPDTYGVIVTGPYMPTSIKKRLHKRAMSNMNLRILDFVPEPAILLARADRVIAMGGYNTTGEILSFEKPALIVPRVKPRLEQWIRAQRLHDLGLLDVLHPDEVSPEALGRWLALEIAPRASVRDKVDLDGLSRLPYLLGEALALPVQPAQAAVLRGGAEYAAI